MTALQILLAVAKMIPTVIEAIKVIEAAIPESGKGSEKLELVRVILENAYGVTGQFELLWPSISGTIGVLVKMYTK